MKTKTKISKHLTVAKVDDPNVGKIIELQITDVEENGLIRTCFYETIEGINVRLTYDTVKKLGKLFNELNKKGK